MRARRVVVGLWLGFLWFLFYSLCFLPLLILDFFSCKNEQYIFVSCVWVFFFFWFFWFVFFCYCMLVKKLSLSVVMIVFLKCFSLRNILK
jgi:hypothetical protein